jgi:hypothetical protein
MNNSQKVCEHRWKYSLDSASDREVFCIHCGMVGEVNDIEPPNNPDDIIDVFYPAS